MNNKKIRLGMLGAGRIVDRVMADKHRLENVEITAIAARICTDIRYEHGIIYSSDKV